MPTAVRRTLYALDTSDSSSLADFRRVELDTLSARPPALHPAVALVVSHLLLAGLWLAIWQSSAWIGNWVVLLATLVPVHQWAARSREHVASGMLSSLLTSLAALAELGLASALLTSFGSDGLSLAVFLAWAVLAVSAGWRYACERDRWSMARLSLGSDPTVPRAGSDEEAAGQFRDLPERMDRWSIRLNWFGPYGWLLVGVATLLPAFTESRVVVGLGGLWLAFYALRTALAGVSNLIAAAVASRYAASSQRDEVEPAVVETEKGRTVVQGRDRTYRWYPDADKRRRTTKSCSAA